jgi:hypothetical protein
MAPQTLTAVTLTAGIAIGAGGTISAQEASADKILYVKSDNTKLKVANLTQVEDSKWVVVVCGIMHDNDGNALPETCHQCDVSFPVSLDAVKECHAKGEGLK